MHGEGCNLAQGVADVEIQKASDSHPRMVGDMETGMVVGWSETGYDDDLMRMHWAVERLSTKDNMTWDVGRALQEFVESELGAACFLEVKAPGIHQKRERLRVPLDTVNRLLGQEAQSEYLQRVEVPGMAPPAG